MRWKRDTDGSYVAGPYRVKRPDGPMARYWHVAGPGVASSHHDLKAYAQEEAERVATIRANDPDANAPVVGDVVEVIETGRRGQVTAIMDPDYTSAGRALPLHCIKFTRGKRLCVFRHEIKVVVP